VEWPIYGTIDEERKWKIEEIKFRVATMMSRDLELVDDYYIYKNIMLLPDDAIEEITTRMDEEEMRYAEEYNKMMAEAPEVETEEELMASDEKEEPEDEEDDEEEKESIMRMYESKLAPDKVKEFKHIISDEKTKNLIHEFIELTKLYKNWK
jgi:hypothetical protein